jgi:hypothetical protein
MVRPLTPAMKEPKKDNENVMDFFGVRKNDVESHGLRCFHDWNRHGYSLHNSYGFRDLVRRVHVSWSRRNRNLPKISGYSSRC